jgi:tripartite-type tricarboxylate transporter receptor subunit TctC
MRHRAIGLAVAMAALVMFAGPFVAEAFPQKELRVVVPWSAGGRTDVAARVWAPTLQRQVGVPVVVDNKPGGGGVVGAREVARAGADGHTIGVFSISHIIAQWTKIPPFELEAYTPVALPFSSPFVLVVKSGARWDTLEKFVKHAREQRVTFGTSGAGASVHIAAAAFARAAGINARYVPYQGDAGAIRAVVGGEVDVTLVPMIGVASLVAGGELRPLAVSLDRPDELHTGIPTFKEQGVDFVFNDLGSAIFVPRGTPEDVVRQWEQALRKVFTDPAVTEALRKVYVQVDFADAAKLRATLAHWNPVLKELTRELGLEAKP